ncbi:MAG: hypothetical protein AAF682_19150 [Planctomycetota bacterium]
MSPADAEELGGPSETAADAAPERRESHAPRESAAGVVGVAIGLLLLVGLAVSLAQAARAGGADDGEERLEEILPAPRPFGLELVESAILPSGDRLLRLEPREASGGLDEVVLLLYRGPSSVVRLFRGSGRDGDDDRREESERMQEWEEDPDFDWHVEVDRGDVTWRGWRANFVRERAFEEGGGWRDATRVNLSQGERYLVLFALWEPESAGSEGTLEELLAHVVVSEDPESQPAGR